MPRRKKYATRARLRRSRRRAYTSRYTRRRRVAGKRTRRKKYHMSRKRRSLAKTYGLRKYAGIKWTRYLSLAEFLGDDKWDLQWLYCLPFRTDGVLYEKNGTSTKASANLVSYATQIMLRQYAVLSTDLWSNKTMQAPRDYQQALYWKAYNPFPHSHNLGPLFNIYCTQYRKMKYVGMKVKWIPGCSRTTTFFPQFTSTTNVQSLAQPVAPYQLAATVQNGTAFTLYPNAKLTETTSVPDGKRFHAADSDHKHIAISEASGYEIATPIFTTMATPPAFRLWINFDKQGYEGYEFKTNCVQGSTLVETDVNFRNARIRFARLFNVDGFKASISDKLVKSYSLLKPFKFFVRPKMALRFQENIENASVLTNAEPTSTLLDSQIESIASEADSYLATNKKMPYLSVMQTSPSGVLTSASWDTANANSTAVQIIRSIKSDGYFDPILFGWGLSCDNLEVNEQLDYFRVYNRAPIVMTDGWNHIYETVTDSLDYKNYGKFKVTYYCRFKDFNPLQNPITPSFQQVQNAVLEDNNPNLPQP